MRQKLSHNFINQDLTYDPSEVFKTSQKSLPISSSRFLSKQYSKPCIIPQHNQLPSQRFNALINKPSHDPLPHFKQSSPSPHSLSNQDSTYQIQFSRRKEMYYGDQSSIKILIRKGRTKLKEQKQMLKRKEQQTTPSRRRECSKIYTDNFSK